MCTTLSLWATISLILVSEHHVLPPVAVAAWDQLMTVT